MSKEKSTIPQFETEEQEAEYFDEHSPLDIIAEPKIEKIQVRGAKDRPITIRLDSETRAKLNILAAKQRLGPSTFARIILTSAVERQNQMKAITLDQLKDVLESNLPQSVKDRYEALIRKSAIGDPDNPAMLIIDASQEKEYEEVTLSFLKMLLALIGIQLVIPEKENYQKLKEVVKSQV